MTKTPKIYDVNDLWTAQECADYIGVERNTWYTYVNRPTKKNPAPKPVTKKRYPLWDPDEVRAYATATNRREASRAERLERKP